MVKATETENSMELLLKIHKKAMDILNQVELTPEIRYEVINFPVPQRLLTPDIIVAHIVGVIRNRLGIPMSEIIKAAETGTEPPSLARKLRLAEIAKEKEEMLKELARLRREEEAASKAQGKLLNHWVELGHEEDRLQDEEDRLNPKKEEE